MTSREKVMEDEILSLASTIKKNMVDPAGQRLEEMEIRISAAEKSIILLHRAFFAASVVLAAALGTIIYYLATGSIL